MFTPKERWLAAIRMAPVDRLPFWPKLDDAYPPAQTAPHSALSLDALHAWIGSDPHRWVEPVCCDVHTSTAYTIQTGNGRQRINYATPYGTLTAENIWDEASRSWHPVEFPVKTRDDLPVMTAWYADARAELQPDALVRARETVREIGAAAVVGTGIGESPLMQFVEWLAGIEHAHYLLADARGEVEALFDAMHRLLRRRMEISVEFSPADLLYLVENTSTTLISPAQYRTYCTPLIADYARLTREGGRHLVLHMCGHLKALLPDLAAVGAAAFEAITSPTLGNTTLSDGRAACPDVCLIGGTNATLWMRPAREIIAKIEEDLDALPHHRGLVLTSAGVMPPGCKPETIKTVGDWVKRYPVRA